MYLSYHHSIQVCSNKLIRENKTYFFLYSSGDEIYSRGDLFLVTNFSEEPIHVGDNVAFQIEGRDIHIIHRVIKMHEK